MLTIVGGTVLFRSRASLVTSISRGDGMPPSFRWQRDFNLRIRSLERVNTKQKNHIEVLQKEIERHTDNKYRLLITLMIIVPTFYIFLCELERENKETWERSQEVLKFGQKCIEQAKVRYLLCKR